MLQAAQLADDYIRLNPNIRGSQYVQIIYNVSLAIMIKNNELEVLTLDMLVELCGGRFTV